MLLVLSIPAPRSYAVYVKQALKCKKAISGPAQNLVSASQSRIPLVTPEQSQHTIDGRDMVEVDVIYVPARNAKEIKNELESLNYLDKRYKLAKVERRAPDTHDGEGRVENLIAVPITKRCVDQLADMATILDKTSCPEAEKTAMVTSPQGPEHCPFQRLMVGCGTERVPYSASSIGRMKQRR